MVIAAGCQLGHNLQGIEQTPVAFEAFPSSELLANVF